MAGFKLCSSTADCKTDVNALSACVPVLMLRGYRVGGLSHLRVQSLDGFLLYVSDV